MDISLSGQELIMMMKGDIPNLVSYNQLKNYDSLDHLLGKSKMYIII